MKRRTYIHKLRAIYCASLLGLLLITACNKNDYIVGGSIHDVNKHINTSSFDVLKLNDAFDTLVKVIEAAGFQDEINKQGITFFTPTDHAINSYLEKRTAIVQNTINQNGKFDLDSLLYYVKNNTNNTRDSLKMYLINGLLDYSVLTTTGKYYPTGLPGDSAIVSYEYTTNVYQGYFTGVTSTPQLVYFTKMWYPFELSAAHPVKDVADEGVHTVVSTSGIKTKNGIIHVLGLGSSLFFYGSKK